MRRLAIIVLWVAAVLAVVAAVGMRVRAHRLNDPAQALRMWLRWVPPDIASRASIISRSDRPGAASLQVSLRGDDRMWLREFIERNGFVRADTQLSGLAALRWTLSDGPRPGSMVHLLVPDDRSPAVVTAMDAPADEPRRR